MPLLGPGRAFFSLQWIQKEDSTARMHCHSAVNEYYLVLQGKGTLRLNGKALKVGPGDLIAKPTGPDAATHLNAARGESLRILDMEIWHEPFKGSHRTSKHVVNWPDYDEEMMRGPGWAAVVPTRVLLPTKDVQAHWSESYRRTKGGKRVGPRKRSKRRGS